jgi:hypothetical protein
VGKKWATATTDDRTEASNEPDLANMGLLRDAKVPWPWSTVHRGARRWRRPNPLT